VLITRSNKYLSHTICSVITLYHKDSILIFQRELDDKFIKEAELAGIVNIKGHKLVGGMRASIYNAMPVEGVESLINFMKKFEKENR
jgi:phosphoserine aminotransferase